MEEKSDYLYDLFIEEAKPALNRHSGSGGGSSEDIEIITYLDCAKIDGGYEITGLNDTSVTDIIIPSKCNGEPVIRIGDYAFGDYVPSEYGGNIANITSVIIQNGVREIGKFAFELCPLTSVTIANSVTKIDESAFAETLITSVVIPENVSYIGDFAFGACPSLVTATFKGTPDTIDYQGDGAFIYCDNLTDIYVPWSEGEVANAPWGATNATIHYNSGGVK